MKTTLDDFQKLSDAQQDAVAEVVLLLSRKRQELREQARGYRGFMLLPILTAVAGPVTFLLFPDYPALPFALFLVLLCLIQFHAIGINRRLDALLELSREEPCDLRVPADRIHNSVEPSR